MLRSWSRRIFNTENVNFDSIWVILRQYLENFAIAILVALILRFFVVSAYQITSESMAPTFYSGDFIIVYKLPYGWPVPFMDGTRVGRSSPKRGEVVVIQRPEDRGVTLIKRVVGIAGDRVEVKNGRLFVNDEPATYSRTSTADDKATSPLKSVEGSQDHQFVEHLNGKNHRVQMGRLSMGESHAPVVVPPGYLFLLGDNREIEEDSRLWGVVPETFIVGKATFIWLSLDWSGRDPQTGWPKLRTARVFKSVD